MPPSVRNMPKSRTGAATTQRTRFCAQGQEDVVGYMDAFACKQLPDAPVAQSHEDAPSQQPEVVVKPTVGVLKALHRCVSKPHAHAPGQGVEDALPQGRHQSGNVGNVVEHHQRRHKEFNLIAATFSHGFRILSSNLCILIWKWPRCCGSGLPVPRSSTAAGNAGGCWGH